MFEKNPYFGGGNDGGGTPALPLDGDLPLIMALLVTALVMALVLCKMMDRRARRNDDDPRPEDQAIALDAQQFDSGMPNRGQHPHRGAGV